MSPAACDGQPWCTATQVDSLTARRADGASRPYAAANSQAEYRPNYCLATDDAAAAVSGCAALACAVPAIAAGDAGEVMAADGLLADVAGVLFEHAATQRTAETINVLLAIPFLMGVFPPTCWACGLMRDSLESCTWSAACEGPCSDFVTNSSRYGFVRAAGLPGKRLADDRDPLDWDPAR